MNVLIKNIIDSYILKMSNLFWNTRIKINLI